MIKIFKRNLLLELALAMFIYFSVFATISALLLLIFKPFSDSSRANPFCFSMVNFFFPYIFPYHWHELTIVLVSIITLFFVVIFMYMKKSSDQFISCFDLISKF